MATITYKAVIATILMSLGSYIVPINQSAPVVVYEATELPGITVPEKPPTPEELIFSMMKNPETMIEIAECENREFDPKAVNKKTEDKGIFQIHDPANPTPQNPSTWRNFNCQGDIFDAEDNIRCAIKIQADGLHHWKSSRHCWGE